MRKNRIPWPCERIAGPASAAIPGDIAACNAAPTRRNVSMSNIVEVKVPDIGNFKDVDVIEVMVKAGDPIEKEQGLITLETDKATMDVPAPEAGTVREMKVKQGDKVSEGSLILTLEISGVRPSAAGQNQNRAKEPKPAAAPAAKAAAAVPGPRSAGSDTGGSRQAAPNSTAAAPAPRVLPPAPINESGFGKAHAGPSVRKLARELGVDLSRVTGSGRKERITHDDVKAFVKGVMQGSAVGGGLPKVPAVDFAKFGAIEIKPLPRIKKISGPRLQAAWVNVPHVTQHDEADITELDNVRKALKSDAEKIGTKLTMLAFLVKACVATLRQFPEANSSLDPAGENLVYKKYYHIGFAADTPNGLMVPVIRNADTKNVFEIAKELGELAQKARDGKLKIDEMQGGTFSISSLGGIGGTAFTPIVNAPEVAILGVSRSQMKPVWDGKEFQPRLMLPLSLSYDHRVIDGAMAARFTTFLGQVLSEARNLVL
ncbi:MAG: dihydrolipoyllysine-residue acetyltransferase [Gammaproteobacteria bacterium]|nr:dihydrolipoyllysine-residue acetyltransferase [Gammaproteobacteria bacterium]